MNTTTSKATNIQNNYCYTRATDVTRLKNCIDNAETTGMGCTEVTNLLKTIYEYTDLLAKYLHGINFNGFGPLKSYLPIMRYPNPYNTSVCGGGNCLILPYLKGTNTHSSLIPMMTHCLQGYELYNRVMQQSMTEVYKIESKNLGAWIITTRNILQDLTNDTTKNNAYKKKKVSKYVSVINRILLLRGLNENVCVGNSWTESKRRSHFAFTSELRNLRDRARTHFNYY